MILIDSAKRSYKGNTHAHTTLSDGLYAPEQVIELYRRAGYDFLALTDHWQAASSGWAGEMLVLTGEEFDFRLEDQLLHVVGIFPHQAATAGFRENMDYKAVIEEINRVGGAAIAAHPAWSLNTPTFLQALDGICGAEVYNSFSGEPWNAPRADSTAVLDLAATAGRCIPQLAADDSHLYEGEQLRGFTMLQADALTPEGVIAALRRGSFYASQGPEFIHVELMDGELVVHTSPVNVCTFISNLAWTQGRCRCGVGMRENIYPLQPGEKFIRCEIVDAQGRRAWLSPICLTR